jgi:monovalent cation/hydrogen antiporter
MASFEVVLVLVLCVGLLEIASTYVDIPSPIVLVLGGSLLSLVPAIRNSSFPPDLIFLLFVPPLLYWAAFTTSLRDFRKNLRGILLLAVGLVLATIAAVAAVAHAAVPGLGWAPAFVLGAIVSPPDAAVATAVARKLGIPRRLVTVLEGETLMNDTTAFVAYRMAVAAVITGSFSIVEASWRFLLMGGGAIAFGYAVARLVGLLRERLDQPTVENTLSLLTPFAVYIPAESIGLSGVLAVVACGLALGQLAPRYVSAQTRVQGQQLWEMVLFLLNGLIFLFIGLELGRVGARFVGRWHDPIWLQAAYVSLTVVGVRILWVFSATYLPGVLPKRVGEHDPAPPLKATTLVAWTGMRGGDSLVTALALPLTLSNGTQFPGRETIGAVAFMVIVVTLVFQGLTLRPLVRLLRFSVDRAEQKEEALARRVTATAGRARLEEVATSLGLGLEVRSRFLAHHQLRTQRRAGRDQLLDDAGMDRVAEVFEEVEREVLAAERTALVKLRDDQAISDDILRLVQRELDLEELRIGRGEADMG